MYAVLPIALALLITALLLLRRFTRIWINRPVTIVESILAGIAGWLFLLALLLWFGGIVITLLDFLSTYESIDTWTLLFAVLLTGYGSYFIVRARAEIRLDDTQELLKEALQFRRSAQRRLHLLSLMHMKKDRRNHSIVGSDPESQQRARFQASLTREKGKVGMLISKLRKLSEVAALSFNNGAPV